MAAGAGSDAVAPAGVGGDAGRVVLRPVLFERLATSARVTVVSAPAGSGKTVLLRSWIGEPGVAGDAGWVAIGRDERDPQRFWLSVLDALRRTGPGSGLVRAVSAAPDLDGWALVERLLTDLAALEHRLWLVIDDVHELGSTEVLRQLELLVMRAPPQLRLVLASRHDVRLGLHRLRLLGGLAEVRAADLRFNLAEARELFVDAGLELSAPTLSLLHERTEGWAAGLRLAALSLIGHPDPERFAAEFSGSERTVAEYLLAEVLDRQSEQVRRLLLRTSVLGRVNGELADLLTGETGGERVLQDLEQANAFVASLDTARTWFRYHQMFADLLQLELRRAAPGELAALHRAGGEWFASHGFPADAVRHAQAAGDWVPAARLLADHWPALYLDGQAAVVKGLLAGFPPGLLNTEAELAVVAAAEELNRGSLDAAGRYLGLAETGSASVPAGRRGQLQLLLAVVALLLARQRGNLLAVAEEASRLQAMAGVADTARPGLGADLHGLALISLGSTEFWASASGGAEGYLEAGIALARQGGRPYLEFTGLAYRAPHEFYHSFARADERARRAVELAEWHGWTDDPAVGVACTVIGLVLVWHGQPDEAEPWIQRAERTLSAETQPGAVLAVRMIRGTLELARDRNAEALAALEPPGEPLARQLSGQHYLVTRIQALVVHALVRLGQAERAGQLLAGLDEHDRERTEIRVATAALRIAQGDPQAALAVLGPAQEGPDSDDYWGFWRARADVLEAIARDACGDPDRAAAAIERALDISERSGDLTPFLLYSYAAPGLLERDGRHRGAHASLVAEIQSLLAGVRPAPRARLQPPLAPLSDSELRVLRYLPTNLTAPEVARELYVSANTVKTHMRNVYAKLAVHRRAEAVERARALGLLAPSAAGGTGSAGPQRRSRRRGRQGGNLRH
ncbi:LuxR C-terminal-related transcriptional regulator [Solicola gregarius]|uniref:LuxR C-terminal-related transcriptional regulator n=1 Tax=Solicola gregarius TaxID=2908642 RepID=A0AA46TIP7_9ACTN|nr:LuxR C-terminal-related transcriptional regulator [Solicola gregarius]UYM05868.1 LuxR C-terminal-related transcriptional regulator [Solicola gregarius]